MMMLRLLCLGLALVGAFSVEAPAQAVEQPRVSISIGSFIVGFLPLPLAESLGYFREQGLNVEVQNFGAGGTKALQALIGGSTDAVVGAYDSTIRMQMQGKDIRCTILLNRTPGVAVAVRKDLAEQVRTIRDLKGRTVGITAHGTGLDYIFRYVVAQAGLTPEDLKIAAIGSGQNAVAAMENRSVDAVVHLDPAITAMQRSGTANILFDTRGIEQTRATFGGEYPYSCLYATAEFIDRNPATMQRLVNAFAKALVFIRDHTAAEIADATPPEYQLGGREAFVAILDASKQMFPAVGHFDPADLDRPVQIIARAEAKFQPASIRVGDTYTNRFVDAVPADIVASSKRQP
jgi:NitT/TauT family transport system substrate-binding protein